MRIIDVGCIYLSTQCSEMYHKCFIAAAVPLRHGNPGARWCTESFCVLNFGEKCDALTDQKKKKQTFVLCWCVSGRECECVCVCVFYVWARPRMILVRYPCINTCNPLKALNTVTVYSNGSRVTDQSTELLNFKWKYSKYAFPAL